MVTRHLLLCAGFAALVASSQAQAQPGDPLLIPRPALISMEEGTVSLAGRVSIRIASDAAEDRFAAGQLAEELKRVPGCSPSIGGRGGIPVLLSRGGADSLGGEGYILSVTPGGIEVEAPESAGIFYGVQTLKQLIRANLREGAGLACLQIVDTPALRYRGWQDDISRGPIPTLDYLKREVRELSEYKLNCMTLYTEHVFKLKKHPDIAPDDGITAEEIKELIDYARDYHVEVIGNFQSFGHFYHILKHPGYAHLAETPHVLSPAFEESYDFLADVYAEIAPSYSSPLFNINCDETFGLGSGPARAMMDSLGREGVYAYHINRINDLLKPYGKRMMMWGDIARDYPKIIPKLPRDLIVLPWGYHAATTFDGDILPFTTMGFEFIVCPGVSCWRTVWPDFATALINISNFVRDGVRHGAMGMLNTSWDDDGENLFNYNWYPLIWGAEMAWHPVIPERNQSMEDARGRRLAVFDRAFDPLFFGVKSDVFTRLMNQLSGLRKYAAAGGLTDGSFWRPLVDDAGLPAKNTEAFAAEAAAIAAELSVLADIAVRNGAAVRAAAFAAARASVIAEKQLLRETMGGTLGAADEQVLRRKLKDLEMKAAELKEEYRRLWALENRPWWLDENLAKYDKMMEDIRSCEGYVFIELDRADFAHTRTVTLRPLFAADTLYVTTDGTDPGRTSAFYRGPFQLYNSGTVRVRACREGRLTAAISKDIFVYDGMVQSIKYAHAWAPQYAAAGAVTLVDGVRGNNDFRAGGYLGFPRNDLDAVFDLGTVRDLHEMSAGFLQDSGSWVLFPEWVACYLSDDGVIFEEAGKVLNRIDQSLEGGMKQTFTLDLSGRRARYVRVQAKNTRLLPGWHKSAGGEAWVFVDEVMVR
ncbi:family 20 glycosylhydrolase [bacterium]|nr:family 20 glycosylhydrolase [bacterium]